MNQTEYPFPETFNYVFLPGYGNSLGDHWQAQWFEKIPNAIWVEQKDWDNPVRNDWVSALDKVVQTSSLPIVIVAHSLGCLTFIEWLLDQKQQQLSKIEKIHGAFLVAPPDCERPSFPEAIQGFGRMKLEPVSVRALVVASQNDPYCKAERANLFATAWGLEICWLGEAGHINSAAGFGAWPEGLSLLHGMIPLKGSKH